MASLNQSALKLDPLGNNVFCTRDSEVYILKQMEEDAGVLEQIKTNTEASSTASLLAELKKQNGYYGQYVISSGDGAVAGKNFWMIEVLDDAVISVLALSAGGDVLAAYNLTGKTLPRGTKIFAHNGDTIANVTLASGQVIGYKAS